MNLMIRPGKELHGRVGPGEALGLPGDKSLSHRAALLAAMAEGNSCIENFLVAGVTRPMLEALTILGIPWSLEGTTLYVHGQGMRKWQRPSGSFVTAVEIDCGNSATTLRLLAGALAAWGIPARLGGSASLCRRPMGRIVKPLQQMGVNIEATGECAPLILEAMFAPLHPIQYVLPVASAQVKSCILLAALAAQGTTTLTEPGPSRDHTERMLRSMGVEVTSYQRSMNGAWLYTTNITPPQPLVLSPMKRVLPGDISAAAFLLVAALIAPDSEVMIQGVGLNPTRLGILEVLKKMGAEIQISGVVESHGEPNGNMIVRSSKLHGVQVGGELVVRMIDEFPAFAVAAAYAEGTTLVRDASELRIKESDRISDMCQELIAIGVQAEETPDGFRIHGGYPVVGGAVQSHGDHRLAMALSVAGLASQEPTIVQGAEIMQESFPTFISLVKNLGADIIEYE